jgi:hypothetical protein
MKNAKPFTRAEQAAALRNLLQQENENLDFYREEDIPAVERELDALEALLAELEAGS